MTKFKRERVLRYWPEGHSDQTFYEAMKGDEKAVEVVIETFKPMVHMWAHEYVFMCSKDLYEDLVQEGVIGILRAIETFDVSRVNPSTGKTLKPSTWIWWKTRAEVQGAAKRFSKFSKNLSFGFDNSTLEGLRISSFQDDLYTDMDIEDLIIESCGSLNNRRANILKDKFGLLGTAALRQREVASKYGVSKQIVNTQVRRFIKIVKDRYPTLNDYLSSQV